MKRISNKNRLKSILTTSALLFATNFHGNGIVNVSAQLEKGTEAEVEQEAKSDRGTTEIIFTKDQYSFRVNLDKLKNNDNDAERNAERALEILQYTLKKHGFVFGKGTGIVTGQRNERNNQNRIGGILNLRSRLFSGTLVRAQKSFDLKNTKLVAEFAECEAHDLDVGDLEECFNLSGSALYVSPSKEHQVDASLATQDAEGEEFTRILFRYDYHLKDKLNAYLQLMDETSDRYGDSSGATAGLNYKLLKGEKLVIFLEQSERSKFSKTLEGEMIPPNKNLILPVHGSEDQSQFVLGANIQLEKNLSIVPEYRRDTLGDKEDSKLGVSVNMTFQ